MTSALGPWRRSTYSGDGDTGGGNCVEAALRTDRFALRDSKNPHVTLGLPRSSLTALLRYVS